MSDFRMDRRGFLRMAGAAGAAMTGAVAFDEPATAVEVSLPRPSVLDAMPKISLPKFAHLAAPDDWLPALEEAVRQLGGPGHRWPDGRPTGGTIVIPPGDYPIAGGWLIDLDYCEVILQKGATVRATRPSWPKTGGTIVFSGSTHMLFNFNNPGPIAPPGPRRPSTYGALRGGGTIRNNRRWGNDNGFGCSYVRTIVCEGMRFEEIGHFAATAHLGIQEAYIVDNLVGAVGMRADCAGRLPKGYRLQSAFNFGGGLIKGDTQPVDGFFPKTYLIQNRVSKCNRGFLGYRLDSLMMHENYFDLVDGGYHWVTVAPARHVDIRHNTVTRCRPRTAIYTAGISGPRIVRPNRIRRSSC